MNDLLPLFQWFEATFIGTKVRESLWMFPVIECVHLLALSLLGGTILAVDLRVFKIGLREQPVATILERLHPWMAWSVVMMIATGVPMFLSEAVKCYYSPPFWYKIGILVLAILFAFTVRKRVLSRAVTDDSIGSKIRLTAILSMVSWLAVAFAGRWIAFY